MDFAPEKPALEVDEIHPSQPGGEGTGGEGTVEDANGESILPITMSEEEEPALVHAIVDEELRASVADVAYPPGRRSRPRRSTWAGRCCTPAA
jgi:hypothetical protein